MTIAVSREVTAKTREELTYPEITRVATDSGANWTEFHVRASDDGAFMQHIADRINDIAPAPDGVFGALSGGNDFYFWVREDNDSTCKWKLYPLYIEPGKNWQDAILATMTSNDVVAKLLGFNEGSQAMWMLLGVK